MGGGGDHIYIYIYIYIYIRTIHEGYTTWAIAVSVATKGGPCRHKGSPDPRLQSPAAPRSRSWRLGHLRNPVATARKTRQVLGFLGFHSAFLSALDPVTVDACSSHLSILRGSLASWPVQGPPTQQKISGWPSFPFLSPIDPLNP